MKLLEQLFACGICHQPFSLAKSLSKHVEQYHSRKEPFSCNVCAKKFKWHTTMINHRLVHSIKEEIKSVDDFSSDLSKTEPKIKTNIDKGY